MLRVNKFTLIILINMVWAIAGVNILNIGVGELLTDRSYIILKLLGAFIVFIPFFTYIFRRMSRNNINRINARHGDKHPPYALLDIKGYIIILFMIHLGMVVRKYSILNSNIIAMFYIGLSLALISTAVKSLIKLYKETV